VNRKTDHLKKLAAEHAARGGKLVLHQADLLDAESFIEPIRQCSVIYHTASPFQIGRGRLSGQKRFIDPAVRGTENVLLACLRPETRHQIQRVVVTSSIAAVAGYYDQKKGDPVPIYDESDWNTTSTPQQDPYSYSKTEAEKLAWRLATDTQNSDKSWDLVTILPGFVLGPSLTKETESGSIEFMRQLLGGRLALGAPAWQQSIVDVRDVAMAHLRAGSDRHRVPSGRYILVAASKSILDIASALRAEWGERFRLPQRELPKWLMYLVGPLVGLPQDTIRHRIGLPIRFNTAKSRTLLGMEYRNMNQSIVEHAQQMIADGLVTLKM
jgi:dihydroflavonol-4-reductase